jgi:hypothetical protein
LAALLVAISAVTAAAGKNPDKPVNLLRHAGVSSSDDSLRKILKLAAADGDQRPQPSPRPSNRWMLFFDSAGPP